MSEKYVESIITPLSDGTDKQKYIIRDKKGRELISELTDNLNQSVSNINGELDKKVDKVTGKGLSTNDYTTAQKNKLSGIASGAEVNVQADWNVTNSSSDAYIKNKPTIDTTLSSSSINAVQNKVINTALGGKVDKVTGKGLSTNDYTTAEKNKLAGIASGAQVNVQADWNTTATSADSFIKNKPNVYTKAEIDEIMADVSSNFIVHGQADFDNTHVMTGWHLSDGTTFDAIQEAYSENKNLYLLLKGIASESEKFQFFIPLTSLTSINLGSYEEKGYEFLDNSRSRGTQISAQSFLIGKVGDTVVTRYYPIEGYLSASETEALKYVHDSQVEGGVILNSTTNYAHTNSVAAGINTTANYNYTFTEGSGTLADGMCAHAEGGNTTAKAIDSHAEGSKTLADGAQSHAEGSATTTTAPAAHAEAYQTYAGGASAAHAEGANTLASAGAAHAEGNATTASGQYAHAEGNQTFAQVESSHAEGSATTASGMHAHAEGANTLASSSGAHAEGTGTKAKGMYSHAEGIGTTAQAQAAHAEGLGTSAVGSASHAEGNATTASGYMSHAEGYQTIAAISYAHAEGSNTSVDGVSGHAEGHATTAMTYAHSEGDSTLAYGQNSHSEGTGTIADAFAAHAEGSGTTASGVQSHAEGFDSKASGVQSHAEGLTTTAEGSQAHAEGVQTLARGNQAHAEGIMTTAANTGAHSEGNYTLAYGYLSHAEGDHTIASQQSQHVFGEFNKQDPSTSSSRGNYIEIVGNGTATTARSNARTLDWSGNEWLAGNSTVAGGNLTLGSVTITEPTNNAAQFLNATGGWSVPAGGGSSADGNTTYTLTATTGSNSTLHLVSGSSTVANVTIPNTTNTTYGPVSSSANGLMSSTDKKKLDAMSTVSQSGTLSGTTGTDNYKVVLSKIASTATIPAASTSAAGVMTTAQVNKLNGIAAGANNYTHPSYTAATGAPTANQSPGFGGTFSVNQVNRDATGHIGSLTNRTITIPSAVVTTAANGLMSSTDKKKLDAMSTVDNNTTYTLTISTAANSTAHLVSGSSTIANITIPNTTNTTYGLATTAKNGLLSSQMYQLLINNAIGANESSINGINAINGYQIHLSLANLYTDDYSLEDYATIPAATTATYGVVKPDGTATHFLNGTGGWTAPSEGTSYNTMSSAQMIAGTATTNRVINAANLTNYIKNSVVPIGSIRYTTTSAAPTNFGTWTELWSMENFKNQLRQNESFWPAYCGVTSESVVFAVTIPHLSQAMSFNPQEGLPWIGNDFGSGGSGNTFRYFNHQTTLAVLDEASAGGSTELELYTRSVIGDTIRVDFRGYHNLWKTGTSGSSTYAKPINNSVGMLRCSFLIIYNLPPCWCWIRTG